MVEHANNESIDMIARVLSAAALAAWVSGPVAAADTVTAPDPEAPDTADIQLASVNAIVAELDTDTRLYAKNAERVVPIASITKLMTAIVVLDSGEPLDEWLTIVEREQKPPNNGYSRMRVGSELQRGELLRLALMASENAAAYVLARHHPGGLEAFVDAMNDKARALGMTRTWFVDPSGLSAGNRSTAADVLRMLQAAADYEPIREFTRTRSHVARFRRPRYTLGYVNTNVLVHRDHWDIGLSKTGYLDEAGRCLVMLTSIDGREVGMVLLDSFGKRTPVGDAGRIRQWITTGSSGSIAEAALDYAHRKAATYRQTNADD